VDEDPEEHVWPKTSSRLFFLCVTSLPFVRVPTGGGARGEAGWAGGAVRDHYGERRGREHQRTAAQVSQSPRSMTSCKGLEGRRINSCRRLEGSA
jgi:hypothetical protein